LLIGNNHLTVVNFIQNYFFETFAINHPGFGTISLGYFSALKEIDTLPPSQQDEVTGWLKELFSSCSIIGGDLNTTPAGIKKLLLRLKKQVRMFDLPTYFFHNPALHSPATLPCFDNFLVADPKIELLGIRTLIGLPKEVREDPRRVMSRIGSPSDHAPVIGRFSKAGISLTIGLYNVADPLFWATDYPATAAGFKTNAAGEHDRREKLKQLIEKLAAESNLVILSEVPSGLTDWLSSFAHRLNFQSAIRAMARTAKDEAGFKYVVPSASPEISKLVLLWR
jgi:hypothetical protein